MRSLTDARGDVASAAARGADICRNLENARWTGQMEYPEDRSMIKGLAENQRRSKTDATALGIEIISPL
jgi:hypothetical protein